MISVIFMPQFNSCVPACVLSLQHAPMQCALKGLPLQHVPATQSVPTLKCVRNNVSPFARARNICCGNKRFLKKVQKHFLLLKRKKCFRNKSFQCAQTGKHLGNIFACNNVSETVFPRPVCGGLALSNDNGNGNETL